MAWPADNQPSARPNRRSDARKPVAMNVGAIKIAFMTNSNHQLGELPAYHRRIAIVPRQGEVTAALEDDIHCMAVTLGHDGSRIVRVSAEMDRAPWNSCPGAMEVVRKTFEGALLAEVTVRGGKRDNCTHLYDLAELSAAHALDAASTIYDVTVTDPVDGKVTAHLRRDGEVKLDWVLADYIFVEPTEIAGRHLGKIRPWIETLEPAEREAARILQWASFVAHGRWLPWEKQSVGRLVATLSSQSGPSWPSGSASWSISARAIGARWTILTAPGLQEAN
jgi:hypothetical protein